MKGNKQTIRNGALLMLMAIVGTASLAGTRLYDHSSDLAADLLLSDVAPFHLWYLENATGVNTWQVSPDVGNFADLPLGIAANTNQNTEPIDSVEFRISGIPAFMVYDSVSAFPGYHVDAVQTSGNGMSIFITPEEFLDTGNNPGGPTGNDIGDLMEASSEMLRLRFEITAVPIPAVYPLEVNATITARDGEFTRYEVDGNPNFPGNNPGTIEIHPLEGTGEVQIEYTTPKSHKSVELQFTVPVMAGGGSAGSENPVNYYIYKCGAHVPAATSNDPNGEDVSNCRLRSQGSIPDLENPETATKDSNDPRVVTISLPDGESFAGNAYYIVRVDNVADEYNSHWIPSEGVYSQMFQWVSFPTVERITATDKNTLILDFNQNLCAAAGLNGINDVTNYEIIACNPGTSILECTLTNDIASNDLTIQQVAFDLKDKATVTTSDQEPGAFYVVRIQDIKSEVCHTDTMIPADPPYYAGPFIGYAPGKALDIGFSTSNGIHLPWREKLYFRPSGGIEPFSWEVIPAEAGTFNENDPDHVVFQPALLGDNNQPLHDERDVVIRLTDGAGQVSEIPVHILRRGDLGGDPPLFLDKTDVQDVNDVAAGWKR